MTGVSLPGAAVLFKNNGQRNEKSIMKYITPQTEVVGPASKLIQAKTVMRLDGTQTFAPKQVLGNMLES